MSKTAGRCGKGRAFDASPRSVRRSCPDVSADAMVGTATPCRRSEAGRAACANAARRFLAANAQTLDERPITGFVARLDVIEQLTALGNEFEETAT